MQRSGKMITASTSASAKRFNKSLTRTCCIFVHWKFDMYSPIALRSFLLMLLVSVAGVTALYSQDALHRSWNEYNKGNIDSARKILSAEEKGIATTDSLYLLKAYLSFEEADPEHTVEFIDSALSVNPSFAPAYVLQGLLYYDDDDAESLTSFTKAIYLDPLLDTAYFYRSFLRIRIGDYQGALQDLTLCRKLDPKNIDVLFAKAVTLFFLDRKNDALKTMSEYESLCTDDSLVLFRKGQFLTLTYDTLGAIKEFTTLIDSGWYLGEAKLRRAFLYVASGKMNEAIADVSDVIMRDTAYPPLYLYRGAFYLAHGDTAKAIDDYTKAVQIDSTYFPAVLARAQLNTGKKDYLQAIKDYTQIANAGFYSSEIFQTIGELNESAKNYRDAETEYSKAMMLDEEDPELFFKRGKARYDGKRYQAAIGDFTEALRLDSTNTKYYYYRGMAYDELNELETAIKDYDAAIELDDSYASLYHMKGWALFHLDRYKEALRTYEKAMELSPKNARYVCIHGNIYLDMEKYDDAMDDYRRAISLDSLYAAPVSNIGLIYERRGDTLEALRWFEKAISVDSTNIDGKYNKGRVLCKLGRYEEALPFVSSLATTDSKYTGDANYYTGEVYRKLEKDSLAIAHYRKSIDLNSHRASSYAAIGDIYRSTAQYDLAKKEYEYAVMIDTDYYGAWYILASTEKRLGSKERALECYRTSKRIDSSYGDVDYWIGELEYELGNYQSAIRSLSDMIQSKPNEEYSYYQRALCYLKTKDTALALVDLDRALVLSGNYPKASSLRSELASGPLSSIVLSTYRRSMVIDESTADGMFFAGLAYQTLKDTAKAISYYERSNAMSKKYTTNLIHLYKRSDPEKAMRYTNDAIGQTPEKAELYQIKGEIALMLKDTLGAIKANTECIQLDSNYFDAYTYRGFYYMITHDMDAAIVDFEKAVTLRPTDIYSLNKLGFVYMKRKDYARSLGFYERSYAADNTVPVLRTCAYCKMMLKQNEEAEKDYKKLIELEPNYAENYYFIGFVYGALSKNKEACSAFETAKKLGFTVDIVLIAKYCSLSRFNGN